MTSMTKLPYGWWESDDWPPGSATSWRDQERARRAGWRASGRMRKDVRKAEKEAQRVKKRIAEDVWLRGFHHGDEIPLDWVEALRVMQ